MSRVRNSAEVARNFDGMTPHHEELKAEVGVRELRDQLSSVGTSGTSVLAAKSWSPCAVVGSRGYRWWTTPTRLLICVRAAWFANHNGPGGGRAAENCSQRTAPSPNW